MAMSVRESYSKLRKWKHTSERHWQNKRIQIRMSSGVQLTRAFVRTWRKKERTLRQRSNWIGRSVLKQLFQGLSLELKDRSWCLAQLPNKKEERTSRETFPSIFQTQLMARTVYLADKSEYVNRGGKKTHCFSSPVLFVSWLVFFFLSQN